MKEKRATIRKVISCLKFSPVFLETLIQNVTFEKLKTHMIKNRWSAHEHVCHVCLGEKYSFHKRVSLLQNEKHPVIEPFSGNDLQKNYYVNLDIVDCLKEFKTLRQKTINLVTKCPDEFWEKKADHPEYKIYTPISH